MCAPKAPKIRTSDSKQPDPAIIRNPYLDNVSEFALARMGRSQLRIDPGSGPRRSPAIPLPPSSGGSTSFPTLPSPIRRRLGVRPQKP